MTSRTHAGSGSGHAPAAGSRGGKSKGPQPLVPVLRSLLQRLRRHDVSRYFWYPVSAVEVPVYYQHIAHPMDFAQVEAKIARGAYSHLDGFLADCLLICRNCLYFNSDESAYYKAALSLQKYVHKLGAEARKLIDYSLPLKPPPVAARKAKRSADDSADDDDELSAKDDDGAHRAKRRKGGGRSEHHTPSAKEMLARGGLVDGNRFTIRLTEGSSSATAAAPSPAPPSYPAPSSSAASSSSSYPSALAAQRSRYRWLPYPKRLALRPLGVENNFGLSAFPTLMDLWTLQQRDQELLRATGLQASERKSAEECDRLLAPLHYPEYRHGGLVAFDERYEERLRRFAQFEPQTRFPLSSFFVQSRLETLSADLSTPVPRSERDWPVDARLLEGLDGSRARWKAQEPFMTAHEQIVGIKELLEEARAKLAARCSGSTQGGGQQENGDELMTESAADGRRDVVDVDVLILPSAAPPSVACALLEVRLSVRVPSSLSPSSLASASSLLSSALPVVGSMLSWQERKEQLMLKQQHQQQLQLHQQQQRQLAGSPQMRALPSSAAPVHPSTSPLPMRMSASAAPVSLPPSELLLLKSKEKQEQKRRKKERKEEERREKKRQSRASGADGGEQEPLSVRHKAKKTLSGGKAAEMDRGRSPHPSGASESAVQPFPPQPAGPPHKVYRTPVHPSLLAGSAASTSSAAPSSSVAPASAAPLSPRRRQLMLGLDYPAQQQQQQAMMHAAYSQPQPQPGAAHGLPFPSYSSSSSTASSSSAAASSVFSRSSPEVRLAYSVYAQSVREGKQMTANAVREALVAAGQPVHVASNAVATLTAILKQQQAVRQQKQREQQQLQQQQHMAAQALMTQPPSRSALSPQPLAMSLQSPQPPASSALTPSLSESYSKNLNKLAACAHAHALDPSLLTSYLHSLHAIAQPDLDPSVNQERLNGALNALNRIIAQKKAKQAQQQQQLASSSSSSASPSPAPLSPGAPFPSYPSRSSLSSAVTPSLSSSSSSTPGAVHGMQGMQQSAAQMQQLAFPSVVSASSSPVALSFTGSPVAGTFTSSHGQAALSGASVSAAIHQLLAQHQQPSMRQ